MHGYSLNFDSRFISNEGFAFNYGNCFNGSMKKLNQLYGAVHFNALDLSFLYRAG